MRRPSELGYRCALSLWRRFSVREFLGLLLLVLAILLAMQGKSQKIVLPLVGAYCIIALWRFFLSMRAKESRYALQGQVVAGLFDFINRELFSRSSYTRFTLFRQAPFRPSLIIPWYRFRRGGNGPIRDADASRSKYRRGEGITGRAWETPATKLAIQVLPQFSSRPILEAYYIGQLGVTRDHVADISAYMDKVRAIVSYAFLDHHDQFLGLMSLDIQNAEVHPDEASIGITPGDGNSTFTVKADELFRLVRALGSILDSFQLTKGGAHEQT
jgi:hypothetical protein